MDTRNNPAPSTADSQKTMLSRLYRRCLAFVERVFPNLSQKSPLILKVIAAALLSLIVLLISVFVTLSATSCGTMTKALVSNSDGRTTITITTTNEPAVEASGSLPVTINPKDYVP